MLFKVSHDRKFVAISALLGALASVGLFASCAKQQNPTQDLRKQRLRDQIALHWRSDEDPNAHFPPWNPLALGYCALAHHAVHEALQETYPELRSSGQNTEPRPSLQRAHELANSGKLQEAAWTFEELGDTRTGLHLRNRLFEILNSDLYTLQDHHLGGSFPKKFLAFTGHIKAVYKYLLTEAVNPFHDRNSEIAAYRLDQLLRTRLVPMTIKKNLDGTRGSLSYFIEGAEQADLDVVRAKTFSTLKVFDYITGNRDRTPTNILFSESNLRVYAIDNGAGFHLNSECGTAEDIVEYLREDPRLMARLMEVTDASIRRSLRTLTRDVIEQAVGRIRLLRGRLQASLLP